jgi:hypothetical protein
LLVGGEELDERLETGWDSFLYWATFYFGNPDFDFDANERAYKLAAIAPFADAKAALPDGDWLTPLGRGFKNKDANLVTHYQFTPFLDWARDEPDDGRAALSALWATNESSGADRMDGFDLIVPPEVLSGPGIRCNLAAYLLGAADPIRWPNYKVTANDLACELARYPLPRRECSLGERYGHALGFYDELIDQARQRGMELRDRLDAQGVMWCISGTVGARPSTFTSEQWDEFLRFRTIPSVLRKKRSGPAKRKAPSRRPPTSQVCPICGHDDQVQLVGALDDGWLYVCESGPRHSPPFAPYEFSRTS